MRALINLSFLRNHVEQNPLIWNFAWSLMHKSTIFLPHDPAYFSLKYLADEKSKLILDIGANQGISSLSFRKLCPNINIVAFEPNTSHDSSLKLIARRIKNFEVNLTGLGDKNGKFTLYTPRYYSIHLHTFSSLNHASVIEALNKVYSANIVRKIQIEETVCTVARLDDFNLNPDIIKIDAEGHESKVILGGVETISRNKPSIIFEACHDDLSETLNILQRLEYYFYNYDSRSDRFRNLSMEQIKELNPTNIKTIGNRNLIAAHKDRKNYLPLV